MPAPTSPAVKAAIDHFNAACKGLMTRRSAEYKEAVAAIKASGRPLRTAKTILAHAQKAASASFLDPFLNRSFPLGTPEPLMAFKDALVAPDAFTHGGVTAIASTLIREMKWLLPEEERLIARLRRAVVAGDRGAFDKAIGVLVEIVEHPAVSREFRRLEAGGEPLTKATEWTEPESLTDEQLEAIYEAEHEDLWAAEERAAAGDTAAERLAEKLRYEGGRPVSKEQLRSILATRA